MSLSEPSRAWPWIKRIAKTVAGTAAVVSPPVGVPAGIAVTFLTDLQDDLGKTKPQETSDLKHALAAIQQDTAAIVQQLRAEHPELQPDRLRETASGIAEALYLKNLADEFFYADFKGIEQLERFVSLELDEIFVNLKARPERQNDDSDFPRRLAEEQVNLALLNRSPLMKVLDADRQRKLLERAEKIDAELDRLDHEPFLKADRRADPVSIDRLLRPPGGVVLLGGPGSGKTTLVKRIARSCALGAETLRLRYPGLPGELFPVVVSITLFDDSRGARDLAEYGVVQYVEEKLDERWGPALVQAFLERWAAGQCLLLLDGLDEVAELGRRIGVARAVDGLLQQLGHNRVVVTSRIIGYSICRLSVPADHATLEPFSAEDVATFARQWHRAYDRAVHPQSPRPEQAEREAQSLIDDIRQNPRVADLATNPLMLTIIALIKHQEVTLPDRRVELYEKALNTLIHSWNKARSLSGRPVGETPRLDATKKVWSAVALWMHEQTSRGTLRRQQLHDKLIEVLQSELGIPELAASEIAESYLVTATESSGLLEERGQGRFAFVHQTFQEYLAAIRLATLCRKTMAPLRERIDNPRWHEVIRLAAGFIGVYVGDNEQLTELINTLLDEQRDPLEPHLLTGLRLAASCVADDVGFRQQDVDQVLVRLFERLHSTLFLPLWEALIRTSIPGLKSPPGMMGRPTLIAACTYEDTRVRMHAARLLGLSRPLDEETRRFLETLLTGISDGYVKAQAALALWQSQSRRDELVVRSLVLGLSDDFVKMSIPPSAELLSMVVRLLDDEGAPVRLQAAIALARWGRFDKSLATLVQLLDHDDSYTRFLAVIELRSWSPQEEALPALIRLLDDDESRNQVIQTLSNWGPHAVVYPALIRLLGDDNGHVRLRAAIVLANWGNLTDALPAMVQLLNDDVEDEQVEAAQVLDDWGHRETAIPALLQLIRKDVDPLLRLDAATVLHDWGHQETAFPILVGLLEEDHPSVRSRAAAVLGSRGHQVMALPVLVRHLEDQSGSVRYQASRVLGGWGASRDVVTTLLGLLSPRKKVLVAATVDWLVAQTPEQASPRTDEVSRFLAQLLKPQPRDSAKKRALREVVSHWVWKACGG